LKGIQNPDGHFTFNKTLTGESNSSFSLLLEFIPLGDSPLLGFASDEFNPTGCASSITTTTVENIHPNILDGFDKAFPLWHFKCTHAFNG
jgi:hypothetical protein